MLITINHESVTPNYIYILIHSANLFTFLMVLIIHICERRMGDIAEADLPYRSEYAKSGRSSCKACKTSIGKADLRLAAMVQVNSMPFPQIS